MDFITLISILAASITIGSVVFLIYKIIHRKITSLNNEIAGMRDTLKVFQEVKARQDLLIENQYGRLFTIKKDTTVKIIRIDNGIATFRTLDDFVEYQTDLQNFYLE